MGLCGELVRKKREHREALTYGGMLQDGLNGVDGLDGPRYCDLIRRRKSRLCYE